MAANAMNVITPAIGRMASAVSRLTGHGGSAFPGLVAERIDPGFLARILSRLPYGVVLVSGTNGKTTTTRMIATMLEDLGLRVFTNPTGSNFTRGVASALVGAVGPTGRLPADIAVLELDEAYAVRFVAQVRPRYSVLLNVLRDQLDRFGEIDHTADLLGAVASATTGTVVLNREDPRIASLASRASDGVDVRYFGLEKGLRALFPSDDDMHDDDLGESSFTACGAVPSTDHADAIAADVTLASVGDHRATFIVDGRESSTDVRLEGVYNLYNAAAALAVVRAVLGSVPSEGKGPHPTDDDVVRALSGVTPAFGRGESIDVDGTSVELLLVKNPMGFRLSLASFPPQDHDTMIAICDEYADGRDMSWLWDVDFRSLVGSGVDMVSGTRAWDMALRLEYDDVPVGSVDTDLESAVERFIRLDPGTSKHIYCTYTAMLRVRSALAKVASVAQVGVGR